MRCFLALVLSCLLLVACSKPVPPTLTPERAEIVSTAAAGLVIRVHCKAHNPNKIPLPVRRVEGTMTLGNTALGSVSATSVTTLAAQADTPATFDLTIPWSQVVPAMGTAVTNDDIPYTVDGTAHFEAAGLEFSVPFKTKASVKRSLLIGAAVHSLPPMRLPSVLPKLQ